MSTAHEEQIWKLYHSAADRAEPQPRKSIDALIKARADATSEATEALRLAEEAWGTADARLVPILSLLAGCIAEVRDGIRDEKPLPYLLRAIALAESSPTVDARQLGRLYRQMGFALDAAGDFPGSIEKLRAAVRVFEQVDSPDDECFCVGALAMRLTEVDPIEALPVCRRYRELAEKLEARSTSHYVGLTTLARCLLVLEQGEEAQGVLREAKQLLLNRTKGGYHPWIAELDAQIEEAQAIVQASARAEVKSE